MTKHDIEQKIVDLNERQLQQETRYLELSKMFVGKDLTLKQRIAIWRKIQDQASVIFVTKAAIDELLLTLKYDPI
jgi:hypothetical protein